VMLAERLRRFSAALLAEAGNVLTSLMDREAQQFTLELLLPWTNNIAFVDRETLLDRPKFASLAAMAPGFCHVVPTDCLQALLKYTLQVSAEGLPPLLAKFWRRCATAVPVSTARPDLPPNNVLVLSGWLTETSRQLESERDKLTCNSLLWFIKALALSGGAGGDAPEPMAGAEQLRQGKRKLKGIVALQQLSQEQRRRADAVQDEPVAERGDDSGDDTSAIAILPKGAEMKLQLVPRLKLPVR